MTRGHRHRHMAPGPAQRLRAARAVVAMTPEVPVGTLSPGRGIWYEGRVYLIMRFIPIMHSEYEDGSWVGDYVGSHNALLWDGNDRVDYRNSHISTPNIAPETMVRPVRTEGDTA